MVKRTSILIAAAALATSLVHAQSRPATPNTGGSGLGSAATTPGLLGSPGMGLPPSSAVGNPPVTSTTTNPSVPVTGPLTMPDTTLPGTLTTPGLSTLPGIAPDRSAASGSSSPSRFCSSGSIYNPC